MFEARPVFNATHSALPLGPTARDRGRRQRFCTLESSRLSSRWPGRAAVGLSRLAAGSEAKPAVLGGVRFGGSAWMRTGRAWFRRSFSSRESSLIPVWPRVLL